MLTQKKVAQDIFMQRPYLLSEKIQTLNPAVLQHSSPFQNVNGIYLVWVFFPVNYVIEMKRNQMKLGEKAKGQQGEKR